MSFIPPNSSVRKVILMFSFTDEDTEAQGHVPSKWYKSGLKSVQQNLWGIEGDAWQNYFKSFLE